MNFKRLGHVSFDDGERSKHKAREMRSIYLDTACLVIKMLVHGFHKNTQNLFDQAGIVAMNFIGEVYALPNPVPEPPPMGGSFEDELQFDPSIINKLKLLSAAKSEAVKMMNFEEVIRITDAIELLKESGVYLNKLEDKKREAVHKLHFETANTLKEDMDKIRDAISNP